MPQNLKLCSSIPLGWKLGPLLTSSWMELKSNKSKFQILTSLYQWFPNVEWPHILISTPKPLAVYCLPIDISLGFFHVLCLYSFSNLAFFPTLQTQKLLYIGGQAKVKQYAASERITQARKYLNYINERSDLNIWSGHAWPWQLAQLRRACFDYCNIVWSSCNRKILSMSKPS